MFDGFYGNHDLCSVVGKRDACFKVGFNELCVRRKGVVADEIDANIVITEVPHPRKQVPGAASNVDDRSSAPASKLEFSNDHGVDSIVARSFA